MGMRRKKTKVCHATGVPTPHAIFATGTKLLDIKSEVYRPGGDLVETNN